ncbi:MAG TPA: hypothetical protein VKM36_04555 [Balneolaceae bacterium]|nr:hypothetical protein [Balneolaceae bacterium]
MKILTLVLGIFISFQFLFVQLNEKELVLNKIEETELKDTIQSSFQEHYSEFEYSDGQLFYITDSPATLSIYSLDDGIQQFYKNIQGAGPFEHENIYNLAVSNDTIHLLGYTGKISAWTVKGEPLFEKETGIVRAKDLTAAKGALVISHEGMELNHHLFQVPNSSEDKTPHAFGPEHVFENVLLSVFKNGGTLKAIDESLYVIPPFGKHLEVYKSPTLEPDKSIELEIPDFQMEKATGSRNSYFNDPRKLNAFIEENSLITGFHKIDTSFILEVMHMHDNYRRDLLLYDHDFNLKCHTTLIREIDGTPDPKIRFSDDKYIYYYLESITDQNSIKKSLHSYQPVCE